MTNIKFFTNDDAVRWDTYVNDSDTATFFHLSGWKTIIENSFGHKAFYLYVEENGLIKGILPLFLIKSWLFGKSLVSVPFVVYGGICADSVEAENLLFEEAKKLSQELSVDYLELRNLRSKDNPDLLTKDLHVTFQRDIFPDLDKNMAVIPRKQRRMIRVGIKNKLESKIDNGNLREFYEILAHSYRNLGTPVYSINYIENIMKVFNDSCRILSVLHNGRPVASVMTFFYKDTVIPYYSGALKDSFRLAVNDFMYWELMRYGCENGYRLFDFGKSKKGTGSYDFKRHWGFEPEPLHYQYYLVNKKEMPDVNPLNPKYKYFISTWKKLPLSLTKVIGPRIVKYIP